MRALCVAFALLAAVPLAAMEFEHASSRPLLDAEQTLRMTFATPHQEWGAPLSGGPLRALFIIHVETPGTCAREVVELAQRFDLKADVVFEKDGIIYGGEMGRARLQDLLGRRYDVFVLGQVPLSLLGYQQQYLLLRQVAEGAGLVCIGKEREPILTEARRLGTGGLLLGMGTGVAGLVAGAEGAPSANLVDRIATGYHLKRGRALHIDYTPLLAQGTAPLTPRLDFSWSNLARYEYWSAFVGRALLWAARRELPVTLAQAPLEGKVLEAGRPQRLIAAIMTLNPGSRLRWEASVCRLSDGLRAPAAVTQQGRELWCDLPPLRDDAYMLDLRGHAGKAIACAAALPFCAQARQRVTSLHLSRSFLEPGETLALSVEVEGAAQSGDILRLRARDSYGREVWRQDSSLPGQSLQASFTASPQCSLSMRMEAAWLRGGVELCCRTEPFRVTTRARGHWNMVMWDAPTDVLGYWAVQRMTEGGFNVDLRSGAPPETVAAWGWAAVPYTTRILDEYDQQGRMQPFCWNDQAAVAEHVAKIAQAYEIAREHGVYLYSLGDETTTLGASTDPADMVAYRAWLERQYGTVAALNRSWGSNYKSFTEVDLVSRGKYTGRELALEQAALEAGQSARWFDRQAFARENYLQLCRKFGEAYQAMDPLALTGFEGAGGFADAIDDIVSTNGFWSPYPGTADEVLRSVVPGDYPRSNWIGYQHAVAPILAGSMRLLSNNATSLFWWRWDNIGLFHGYLAADLDFFPTTARLSREMAPFRWGVGDWMMHAQRQHDGIALFHSLAAALAPRAIPGMFAERCELAHRGIQAALEDLGLQYQYLTERMVLAGRLRYPEYRVLILPETHALDARVAARMREFVKAGGLLLADVLPGRFDQHLAPQRRPLDDLFDGRRAALLHHSLSGYEAPRDDAPDQRDGPEGAALRRELASLLAKAHISCPAGVTLASGAEAPPRVELVRWEWQGVEMLGVFRYPVTFSNAAQQERTLNVRLSLREPRYVHVLGSARPPCRMDAVTLPLAPGEARFVAAFPHKPATVEARVTAVLRPGEDFGLVLSQSQADARPVRVELVSPEGRVAPWIMQPVLVGPGPTRVPLQAAYNDPAGKWTVRVTDWFTGQVQQVPVELVAGEPR